MVWGLVVLRFSPDGWLEWLLRPFVLIEPSGGIYFEAPAPDWRFAFLMVFLAAAAFSQWRRWTVAPEQARAIAGLLITFYLWTWISGNGRYFLAGFFLVGPLVVVAYRWLPGTLAFRMSALGLVVAAQAFAVYEFYQPNQWGLVRWYHGPGIPIERSPIRERPAVFLTMTGISYSILVPQFHRQSRWAGMTGQHDLRTDSPVYPAFRALLRDPLPKYLVVPFFPRLMDEAQQPIQEARAVYANALATHGLRMADRPCLLLRSSLTGRPDARDAARPSSGFWFCPLLIVSDSAGIASASSRLSLTDGVFEKIEKACPRYFPSENGLERHYDGVYMRHYPASDSRLYIDENGRVLMKYYRALNPTVIGSSENILEGRFKIDCDKLPGRYQLPWSRE